MGLAAAVGAVFAVAACGKEGPDGSEAPLRIVRQLEPPPQGAFWAPIDVAVSDDRVWVLDVGAAHIYGYDLEGSFRSTIGRKGGGPGELEEPLALGAMSDTLWVLNGGNRRIEYFSLDGAPLGSDPLPDTLPPPVDLVRHDGQWFMSTPFSSAPVVRFDAVHAGFASFGRELEERARELAPRGGGVPSVYRLEVVDGRLWVFHIYLPLVGVYEPDGGLVRLISYPAPKVRVRAPVDRSESGRRRRLVRAPADPAGAMGVLRLGGETYVLTQQRAGDRQTLYRLAGPDSALRPSVTPGGVFFLTSAASHGRSYAVGTVGEAGEPTVFIVE